MLLARIASELGTLRCSACSHCWAAAAEALCLTNGNAFVNRYGANHSLITLRRLIHDGALKVVSEPSGEDTWFPGYDWAIAVCAACGMHAGWQFTAGPASFWGLRADAIVQRREHGDAEYEDEPEESSRVHTFAVWPQ
jgi:hypothetical protein